MDHAELVNRFRFHPANDTTGPLHDQTRQVIGQLADFLNVQLPEGREKSLAITNLEQVMFWANAAIARPAPAQGA